MDAVARLILVLFVERVVAVHGATCGGRPASVYDPYTLATRPLPRGLHLLSHPRAIPPGRVRAILGGESR